VQELSFFGKLSKTSNNPLKLRLFSYYIYENSLKIGQSKSIDIVE